MPRRRSLLLVLSLFAAATPEAIAAPCTPSPIRVASAPLREEIAQQNASLAAARLFGDVPALMDHFAPDSVFMPEHQPRMFGRDRGAAYYRAFEARMPVTAYSASTADILPLGDGAFEWGTFKAAYRGLGAAPLDGKYVRLWRRQPDGSLKLKAEAWGYLAPLADPATHWFAGVPTGPRPKLGADPAIATELDALHAADARSVQQHDTSRIDQYAQDAVYFPFAEKPQQGLAAIRAHLTPYIERGRGATFDQVKVGSDGFEVVDGHVVEYSRFEVHWRAGEASRIASGGGLRLWRREADCSLKMIRQIGTHDHRP